MSEAATDIICAFAALPCDERHAVLLELSRISQADAGALSDDELAMAGEQMFAMYDAEESAQGNSEAG